MPHSVRGHLRLDVDAYDEAIRRFIPGYEEMLSVAAAECLKPGPALVLDLGAGTGALSETLLRSDDALTVELIDVDPEMLERARIRLEPFGERARFRERSFHDPMVPCDGVVASLALHHVPTLKEKRAIYSRIRGVLRPGGVLVNADATVPSDPAGRDATYRAWAEHMVAHGIDEGRAYEHFDAWAEEDTYFPLEDELAAMRVAGLEAACVWRDGPMSILVGRR